MMDEVSNGNVDTIILKDMSRLGRDYLQVGECMEYLRKNGVRLIAINDGVDTFKGDDDFTPFRNIMPQTVVDGLIQQDTKHLLLITPFPRYSFYIPALESHHGVAALISSRSHIRFGNGYSVVKVQSIGVMLLLF